MGEMLRGGQGDAETHGEVGVRDSMRVSMIKG